MLPAVLIRVGLIALLTVFLSSCNGGLGARVPPRIIQKAIAWELLHTQTRLDQTLFSDFSHSSRIRVERVQILDQKPLTIQGLSSYAVQGTYHLLLGLPRHHQIHRQFAFNLILQQQQEGKTWRLVSGNDSPVGLSFSDPIY